MDYLKEAIEYRDKNSMNLSVVALASYFHMNRKNAPSPLVFFNNEQIEEIIAINQKGYDRMEHILSYGNEWNVDEYLLFLTYRINFELINNYLTEHKVTFDIQRNIHNLDETIFETLKRQSNKKNASVSAKLILKNNKDLNFDSWIENVFSTIGII